MKTQTNTLIDDLLARKDAQVSSNFTANTLAIIKKSKISNENLLPIDIKIDTLLKKQIIVNSADFTDSVMLKIARQSIFKHFTAVISSCAVAFCAIAASVSIVSNKNTQETQTKSYYANISDISYEINALTALLVQEEFLDSLRSRK